MNGEREKKGAAPERRRGRRRPRLRGRRDDGMSAVEFVVLTPLLFLLLMLTVQFALFLFARQAAQAAVQDGGRKAREEAASKGCLGGTGAVDPAAWSTGLAWQQDAGNAVTARAQTLGGKLLDFSALPNSGVTANAVYDPTSTAACKVSQVAVTFTADVPTLIPGWHLQVHVESHGPLEQFVDHPNTDQP